MKKVFYSLLFLVLTLSLTTAKAQENSSENIINGSSVSLESFMSQHIITPNQINNLWNRWVLIIVSLDKNEKPVDKAELALDKIVKVSKNNGPQISIEETDLEQQKGRLIRIQCGDNMINQKFDSTEQVKGWAVQTNCKQQKYYFIINPV